jgi:hypothetical protein
LPNPRFFLVNLGVYWQLSRAFYLRQLSEILIACKIFINSCGKNGYGDSKFGLGSRGGCRGERSDEQGLNF